MSAVEALPPGWFHMDCPRRCGWWREFPSRGLDRMWAVQREHVAAVHNDPYWPSAPPLGVSPETNGEQK